MALSEADRRDGVSSEFYEDREWSEKDLVDLIRKEVRIYVQEKRRGFLKDFGVYTLDGKLDFQSDGNGGIKASVDYTELAGFLNRTFDSGAEVRLLVMHGGDDGGN